MTTIITTHYVDEAKGAARVGFMREGRLLAEDSPQVKFFTGNKRFGREPDSLQALLDFYQAPSLEQVFLTLCQVGEADYILSHRF